MILKRAIRNFLFFFALLFCSLSYAQNINYQVEVIALRCNIASDGIFGGPDPTWKVWANDDTDPVWSGGQCIFRDDVTSGSYTLDTNDPSGALPYNIRNVNNSSATQIGLRVEGFEKDCAWFGVTDRCLYDGCCDQPFCFLADEFLCQSNNLGTIDFQNAPQCQWSYYGWFTCGAFDVKVRVRWEYAVAPAIISQPTTLTYDTTLCAPNPLTLTVTADSSATYYQWQVSSNTSLNPATLWTNISGANNTTFTVPIVSGTRNYRVIISSNCIPGFTNGSVISEIVRVTYQPYPATPIVSPLCGSMVLPYSTHNFSTAQPPDSNAIINGGFLWSGTQGLTIHTPNAASTDITFPSYGLYMITVEYIDNCTGLNTISPACQIIVGSSHCDYVYVAPDGIDTSIAGTPANPVRTLAFAITMATGSRNTIRMAGGTYNETHVIHLKEDLTIDGGYAVDTNDIWTKLSSEITTVNIDPPLETAMVDSVNVGFFRGFESSDVSDWTLQDLNVNVKLTGATGTTDRNGHSVYGVHITGVCNNYLFSRCQITVGEASNGEDGQLGQNGFNGNDGGNGIAGGETHNGFLDCDLDANGHGGIGGTAIGSGQNMGGTGGNGGRGGYEEFSPTASGEIGFPGSPGGGNDPGGSNMGNSGNRFSNCTPGNGQVGQNGTDGQNGNSFLTPAITNTFFNNDFWVNAFGLNGGDGFGGGGGQGGGGSSGQGTGVLPFCLPGRGNGGGGGGSGGQGGYGGEGGGGGGAAIAIYASGNSNGIFTSSIINMPVGLPAQGGIGNNGGTGGLGGSGGLGDLNCLTENGAGADGGSGGKGGNGGKGQNGAEGIIVPIALGNNAVLNGTSSSIPQPTIISVNYNNFRGCTNSEIEISKEQGLWVLPAPAYYVNNIDSVTSSFNNGSDTAIIYFDSLGVFNMGANSGVFDNYIRITDERFIPNIIIDASPSCSDSSIYLSADLLAMEYDWVVYNTNPYLEVFSSNFANPVISNLSEGTYIVKLRQRDVCCGWSIPVYETLTVFPELNAGTISGDALVCYGSSPDSIFNVLLASGGSGSNFSYQWQISYTGNIAGSGQWFDLQGANSPSLVPPPLTDTSYFVRQLINDCGILYSNVVTVIVLPELSGGTISADTSLCEGSTPEVFSNIESATGGLGNSSYQWLFSTTTNIPGTSGWNIIQGVNTDSCQVGALTQTTFFVREITDSCGSSFSNVITVTIDSMPFIDAGNDLNLCDTLNFSLGAQLITGNGYWTQISGPGFSTFVPGNQVSNPDVSVTQLGTYTYSWTVTNGTCTDSGTVAVVLNPELQLTLNFSDTTICEGQVIDINVSGGNNYTWLPATYLSSSTGALVTATPDSSIQYIVTGIDSNGCSGNQSVNIFVDHPPTVDAGLDQTLCNLLSFQLNGTTSSGTYSWSMVSGGATPNYNPSAQVLNPTVSVNNFGQYVFQLIAINGVCSDSSQLTVTLFPNPVLSLLPQSATVCDGNNITIVANGADTYNWSPSLFLSSTTGDVVTATPTTNINYIVTGFSSNGCSSTAGVNLTVHDFPVVNLGDSIYLCAEPTIVLDAGGGYQNYLWSTGSTDESISVTQAGTYTIVVDNFGCITSDTMLVLPCIDVSLPNVFTPNGDGFNDVFVAEGNFLESFNLLIFNRWGTKVFESSEIEKGWDGMYQNTEVPDGTYFWIVVYTSNNYQIKNKAVEVKGWVQLIR
ncbi:MAG: gliding motility-associated C-terminal domain-containing protein [Bacteroidales bacterium]|nr:gliding motility-associated C-terminal domain-containing protein [Bacteroidales bacterium]